MPHFTSLVESLPSTVPFVGPETQERARGKSFRARIGANESVFGPSPKAIQAMANEVAQAWKYADPENHDLKHALTTHHGVQPQNIVIGEGIDGILGNLVRMLVTTDVPVVTSLGAYPTFNFHVAGFGGVLQTVPYRDDAEDPLAVAEAVRQSGAPLAYFANPDNPMGSFHGAGVISKLIEDMPQDTVLCLDEAYCEFAPVGELLPFNVEEKRVIRTRTFSKAYGMAGARIGYAIGHVDLIDAFNKVRNHFGVNRIAQAGALAALEDQPWLESVVTKVQVSNAAIAEIARANGLTPLPTATNFVTIDCGRDGAYAKAVVEELIDRDIFVRMPFVEPQNRCIRISSATQQELDLLAESLPLALAAANGA